jgi:hypothetical protein
MFQILVPYDISMNFGWNLYSFKSSLRLHSFFLTNRTWWIWWIMSRSWLFECLNGSVNYGVHIVLRIHCKSSDKVVIWDPRNLIGRPRPRYIYVYLCLWVSSVMLITNTPFCYRWDKKRAYMKPPIGVHNPYRKLL